MKKRPKSFLCAFCEAEPDDVRVEQCEETGLLHFTAWCHGMEDHVVLEYALFKPRGFAHVLFFAPAPPVKECH